MNEPASASTLAVVTSRLRHIVPATVRPVSMGGGRGHPESQHILVALPFAIPERLLARLREQFPNYKISSKHIGETEANLKPQHQDIPDELWKEVTILFTLNVLPAKLELAPRLEILQMYSAGINHIQQHPVFTSSKIPICTSSGIHGPTIAEWVIMTTLVGAHFYNTMHEWQQAQSWGPPDGSNRFTGIGGLDRVRDLAGQRIGILGYGSIGRQVGRIAKAMGMVVLAYTASPRPTPESRKDNGYIVPGTGDPDGNIPTQWFSGTATENLHAFLSADLDVIVISMPLTSKTRGLLGRAELDLLSQQNAFVVNISRGQIIVQDALIDSLRAFTDESHPSNRGKKVISGVGRAGLRGAALDVADPEPLPQGHPLFTTPNCIVTPHISGMSVEYSDRAFDVLKTNIEKFRDGEDLINEVNRERGY